MFDNRRVAVVIPAYNEKLLIATTVRTVSDAVDEIIVVNDASTDKTAEVLERLRPEVPRLTVINLTANRGIGGALKTGYRYALDETDADLIGTMAGDAQCDPAYIEPMLQIQAVAGPDFVKASRFRGHDEELKAMPTYRRIGNQVITGLTQLATGYYNVTDSQNGYGFFTRDIFERLDWDLVGERYDYENTILVALSLAGARVREIGVPAIYGDETSTISFWPTTYRALRAVAIGLARRWRHQLRTNGPSSFTALLPAGILLVGTEPARAAVRAMRGQPVASASAVVRVGAGLAALAAAVRADRRDARRSRHCSQQESTALPADNALA